jgi:transcriptional regulator with XRE-family HTH domain
MAAITKLKLVLLEKKMTQREVAHRSGLNEAIISMVANGRYVPDEHQKSMISEVVGEEQDELFKDT